MIEITPLREDDRQAWQPLAVGYNAFYERVLPDADYDRAWRRLMEADVLHGLAARLDGRVVGIAHYFFHPSIWFDDVCYLADLFVDEAVRGQGAARLLIEAVAGRGAGARLPALLLADAAAQCPRPRPLRQGGALRGLHPLRLSDEPILISGPASGFRCLRRACRRQSGVTPKRRCQNSRLRRSPTSQPSSYSGRM